MPSEAFFKLADADRAEVLATAALASGRDQYMLEKDVWVVWSLSVLFEHEIGEHLSFKGGTSLSKAYRVIDRFSEDIDLTYDIRSMIPEVTGAGNGAPSSRSQGQKWTEIIGEKLPEWISTIISPLLKSAMEQSGVDAALRQDSKERLFVDYRPGLFGSRGYVKPEIMLEFGARSTGEPTEIHEVTCDAAAHITGVTFPTARPRVMKVERTFWEKATAAHVFCLQKHLKGERFARHWHDLAALAKTDFLQAALTDRTIADTVAEHKSIFFREKDASGNVVDYGAAVRGKLKLVPDGDALYVLERDYEAMRDAGMLYAAPPRFADIMAACREIEERANAAFIR